MIYLLKTLDYLYNVSHKEKSIALIKDAVLEEALNKISKKSWIRTQLKQPRIKKSYINEKDSLNLLRVNNAGSNFAIEAISKKRLLNTLLYSSIRNLDRTVYDKILTDLEKLSSTSESSSRALEIAKKIEDILVKDQTTIKNNLNNDLFKNANTSANDYIVKHFTLYSVYSKVINAVLSYKSSVRFLYTHESCKDRLTQIKKDVKFLVDVLDLVKTKSIESLISKEKDFNTFFGTTYNDNIAVILKRFNIGVLNTELFKPFTISKTISEIFKKSTDCEKGITPSEISDFSEDLKNTLNQLHSKDSCLNLTNFFVVEGDSIAYYYNRVNYARKVYENSSEPLSEEISFQFNDLSNPYARPSITHRIITAMQDDYIAPPGILNKSCMRGKTGSDTLSIYTKNPNQIKMLVRKDSKGKVLGRCLLWHGNDGAKYFDRIYVNSIKEVGDFYKWLFINKYINIYKGNEGYIGKNMSEEFLSIKLDNVKFEKYPYVDTFMHLNIFNNTVYKNIVGDDGTYTKAFKTIDTPFLLKMRNTSGSISMSLKNTASYSIENVKYLHTLNKNFTYTDLVKIFDTSDTARCAARALEITYPEESNVKESPTLNKKYLLKKSVYIPELKETVEINDHNKVRFNLISIEDFLIANNQKIISEYYTNIKNNFICKDSKIHMDYVNHIIATKCLPGNNPK